MPVLAVIPARLDAKRLPRKPLRLLAGEPLIRHVARRAQELGISDRVVVATDAAAIRDAVEPLGIEAVMTGEHHASGTERVAEVAAMKEFQWYDLILNIQGDEPFLPRAAVVGALDRVRAGDAIGTAAAPLDAEAAREPSRVKVVVDARGRALYFSRAPIPFQGPGEPGTFWQHIGVYAQTRAALADWVGRPPAAAERAERLEQLRPLHYGLTIGVALLEARAVRGIDTEEDLTWAERHFPDLSAIGA